MKFGENEILEREQKLFSTEHRFLNRLRLDALCFQLFLLLAILAVISVCLIGAFRGIVSSAPTVNEKQILTSSKTTILYDKDGNELQRLDGSGIRQNYVALNKISMAARNAFLRLLSEFRIGTVRWKQTNLNPETDPQSDLCQRQQQLLYGTDRPKDPGTVSGCPV